MCVWTVSAWGLVCVKVIGNPHNNKKKKKPSIKQACEKCMFRSTVQCWHFYLCASLYTPLQLIIPDKHKRTTKNVPQSIHTHIHMYKESALSQNCEEHVKSQKCLWLIRFKILHYSFSFFLSFAWISHCKRYFAYGFSCVCVFKEEFFSHCVFV